MKMTTVGQLVSELYARYERLYHDPELAARATAVVVGELLAARATAAHATGLLGHDARRAA